MGVLWSKSGFPNTSCPGLVRSGLPLPSPPLYSLPPNDCRLGLLWEAAHLFYSGCFAIFSLFLFFQHLDDDVLSFGFLCVSFPWSLLSFSGSVGLYIFIRFKNVQPLFLPGTFLPPSLLRSCLALWYRPAADGGSAEPSGSVFHVGNFVC